MIHRVVDLHVQNSYAQLPPGFFTLLKPQPPGQPQLFHVNSQLISEFGWSQDIAHDPALLAVCSGQQPLPGGMSMATVYSGHQFGLWAGQLGDGRAHLLGEVKTRLGFQEIQLKGSGHTPYSRMGDGRAVLRSSVREYLASEAMAGLGIPTTRALALVTSPDPVYRETIETTAIVTRTAPSFVRFGTFEHFSNQPKELTCLLNYILDRFYPECRAELGHNVSSTELAVCFLEQVVKRTARLIAQWMTVGFCHGVMNTDNMSVLGLTLDYGPFGFMDAFSANHICNLTDTSGRYAWNAQPSVANWNLYRLASSLMGLDIPADTLKPVLESYQDLFMQAYRQCMCNKLGLESWQEQDAQLVDEWWRLLHENQADFTLSFRYLAGTLEQPDPFLSLFHNWQAARSWLDDYHARILAQTLAQPERQEKMNAANPIYILRNHLAQQAIEAAQQGDASEIDTLLDLLRQPFQARQGFEHYARPPAPGQVSPGLSCSS